MKRSLLLFIGLIVVLSLVLSIGGCSSTSTSTSGATGSTLASIAVTPTSPGELNVGDTLLFNATGTYADKSTSALFSVTWASDNPGVATISRDGLVTAVAGGKANITATLSGITSPSVSVTVKAPPAGATPTKPAGITVYVSVSVDGNLLVAAQPVTTTGKYLEDAIKAAHEAYYTGGLTGYTAGIDPTYNMYLVTQCWGVTATPYLILNNAPLGADPSAPSTVNLAKIAANDNIIICTSSDTNKPAQPVSLKVTVSGDSVTLTATAWTLSFTTFTYSQAPLANAKVIDPTTGASLGTTDADGKITITIPASGVVAIDGLAAIKVK